MAVPAWPSQPGPLGSYLWVCKLLTMLHMLKLPCRVTAHFVPVPGQTKPKTTILMKFDEAVIQRNKSAHA